MSNEQKGCFLNLSHIIESWRDEEYSESLNAETRSLLPESPAGEIELDEADLTEVDGGSATVVLTATISFTYWSIYRE